MKEISDKQHILKTIAFQRYQLTSDRASEQCFWIIESMATNEDNSLTAENNLATWESLLSRERKTVDDFPFDHHMNDIFNCKQYWVKVYLNSVIIIHRSISYFIWNPIFDSVIFCVCTFHFQLDFQCRMNM